MRIAQGMIALVAVAVLAAFWQLPAKGEDAPATAKGSVEVTVKDANGAAVANAKVMVLAPKVKKEAKGGGKKHAAPVAEGTTDASGKATLSDIPAGDYTVVAMAKNVGHGKASVTVEAGKTAEVAITLQPKAPKGGGEAPKAPEAPKSE